MPTTSPDNIYYAASSTNMSAEAISAAEATSVQNALDNLINDTRQIQSFVWANSASRTAQTGMAEGDWGFQQDTDVTYRYSAATWTAYYPGGLVPIVPTSVAGTGVSVSSTTGLVTFTSSPSVSLNGVFTSAFTNYKMVVDVTTSANIVGIRLRASGTDNSSSNYDRQTLQGTGATASAASATGQTSWGSSAILSAAHTEGSCEYTIFAPQLTRSTRMVGNVFSADATTAVADALLGLRHRSASAFDGISLVPGSGNITGTMKIYGLN